MAIRVVGGAGGTDTAAGPGRTEYKNGSIVLGDSTSVQPGAAINTQTSTAYQLQANWFHEFCVRSNGAARFMYNAAVGGENTTEILARVQTDVIDRSPDRAFLLIGNNDAPEGIAEATSQSNMTTIVESILDAGIDVVMGTIIPRDATGYHSQHQRANQYIRGLCDSYGLALIDFYKVMVDTSNGTALDAVSTDGTHPNYAGCKAMALQAVTDCQNLPWYAQAPSVPLTQRATDPANLAASGALNLTDTNADGLADNWTKAGTGAATLATVSGIMGQVQRLQKVSSGDTAPSITRTITGLSVPVGRRLAFTAAIETVVEAGSGVYNYSVTYKNSGGATLFEFWPAIDWQSDIARGTLYGEWTTTGVVASIVIKAHFGAGAGTIGIGQVGVFDLTDLR